MPATWEDILVDASWKGIPFRCATVREEHAHDLDERELPGREGTEVEERGRKGLVIDVRAVFVDDDYPEQLQKFIEAIDEGGIGPFVHPVWGNIQTAARRGVVSHDAEENDSATVEVTFIEHTESAAGPFQDDGRISLASSVRAAADDVDVAAVKMQQYLDSLGGAS